MAAARDEAQRAEAELRDYKARAHALLKAKSTEIQSAKDVAREELQAALGEAERRALAAEEQLRQVCCWGLGTWPQGPARARSSVSI